MLLMFQNNTNIEIIMFYLIHFGFALDSSDIELANKDLSADQQLFAGFYWQPNSPVLTSFMQSLNLFNLIKSKTYFNTNNNGIDSILTNSFKHSSLYLWNSLQVSSLFELLHVKNNLWKGYTVITKTSKIKIFTWIFKIN